MLKCDLGRSPPVPTKRRREKKKKKKTELQTAVVMAISHQNCPCKHKLLKVNVKKEGTG